LGVAFYCDAHLTAGRGIGGDFHAPRVPALHRRNTVAREKKLQVVRDYTVGVIEGYYTGLYVYGPGGTSKSYTICDVLRQRKAAYIMHNSRLTGQTLFEALRKAPSAIHLLEDMEALFRQRNAQGVLRSALWGQRADGNQGPMERVVTWGVTGKCPHERRFLFTGGIIMTANRPLDEHIPECQAIMTRIAHVMLDPTDKEVRALMYHLASLGFSVDGRQMAPEECLEVIEYLIAQSAQLQRPLDLRLMENSYSDYLLWQHGHAGCHWHDLVATRLRQLPSYFRHPVATGRERIRQTRDADLDLARYVLETASDAKERERIWHEVSGGQSRATLYRRRDELRQRGEIDPRSAS
jgi:hypothetical protein